MSKQVWNELNIIKSHSYLEAEIGLTQDQTMIFMNCHTDFIFTKKNTVGLAKKFVQEQEWTFWSTQDV